MMKKEQQRGGHSTLAQNSGKTAHLRLVIGVFSRAGRHDAPYRQVIRSTWMQQRGVCTLPSAGPASDCNVYATFVVGNNGGWSTGEGDLTVLPMKENMNGGKTRAWFEHATTHYGWATHVAKMDTDAFPYVQLILTALGGFAASCDNVYGGVPVTCTGEAYCPPRGCGYSVGDDFMQYRYRGNMADCFSYMQGGFYVLSFGLAANASKSGGWWHRESKRCFPEDALSGRAIQHFARESGICVAALKFASNAAFWHRPGKPGWTGSCA